MTFRPATRRAVGSILWFSTRRMGNDHPSTRQIRTGPNGAFARSCSSRGIRSPHASRSLTRLQLALVGVTQNRLMRAAKVAQVEGCPLRFDLREIARGRMLRRCGYATTAASIRSGSQTSRPFGAVVRSSGSCRCRRSLSSGRQVPSISSVPFAETTRVPQGRVLSRPP
jgi:hypothetical protein